MFPRAMDAGSRAVQLIMLVLVVVVLVSLSSSAGAVAVAQPGIAVIRYTDTIGGRRRARCRATGLSFSVAYKTNDLAYIKQSSPSTLVPAYKDATVAWWL